MKINTVFRVCAWCINVNLIKFAVGMFHRCLDCSPRRIAHVFMNLEIKSRVKNNSCPSSVILKIIKQNVAAPHSLKISFLNHLSNECLAKKITSFFFLIKLKTACLRFEVRRPWVLMLISVKMSTKQKKCNIQINITNVLSYDFGVESWFVVDRHAALKSWLYFLSSR